MSYSRVKNERVHARRRCLERLGFQLTREMERQLVHDIQYGNARFIARQSLTISIFLVRLNGCQTFVVYDKQHKQIVTIMPYWRNLDASRMTL